jgi:hypothetical protein
MRTTLIKKNKKEQKNLTSSASAVYAGHRPAQRSHVPNRNDNRLFDLVTPLNLIISTMVDK